MALLCADPLPHLLSGYICFQSVDVKKEVINLERTETGVDANSLSELVPDSSPRYHLFSFKHTHEGDYQEAVGKHWIYTLNLVKGHSMLPIDS